MYENCAKVVIKPRVPIVLGSKNRACPNEIPPSFKLHFCANTGNSLSSEYLGDLPLDKNIQSSESVHQHQDSGISKGTFS